MKTNEKYQDKPVTRREGEPMIEFLRRKFPERNIKHGAPEYKTSPETEKILEEGRQEFLDSLDEWFGDDPEKEILF